MKYLLLAAVVAAAASPVAADTRTSLTVESELSNGQFGQPVSTAIDIEHDVTRRLALAIVSSRYAMTGIRAAAGGGMCMRGPVGCDDKYSGIGVEAQYQLLPGLVAIGGVQTLDLDKLDFGLKVGARYRRDVGRFTFHTTPTMVIPDRWWLTGGAELHLAKLTLDVSTGITAPLDQPRAWEVPLVGSVAYAFHPAFSVGMSFAWPKVIGGLDQPMDRAPIYGFDYRIVQIWFGITW